MIDVSNQPVHLKSGIMTKMDTSTAFDVVGGYAYTASTDNGLYVIDVSDPANPLRSGSTLYRAAIRWGQSRLAAMYMWRVIPVCE